jgi:hypothetical protein
VVYVGKIKAHPIKLHHSPKEYNRRVLVKDWPFFQPGKDFGSYTQLPAKGSSLLAGRRCSVFAVAALFVPELYLRQATPLAIVMIAGIRM